MLLLTAFIWGSTFVFQQTGMEHVGPLTFNSGRTVLAALFVGGVWVVIRKVSGQSILPAKGDGTITLIGGLLCGVCLGFGMALQQIGLKYTTVGKTSFISALYIVIVPFFSVLVGDKVKARSVFCVIMAMIGFAIMSLKGGLGGATAGDWWTLLSAAAFAAQIVTVNQFVDKDNAVALSCLQFLVCGVFGLLIAVPMETPTLAAISAGGLILAYQTLVPTATGYTLQIVGQKYTDSATAALIMSLEAVFAAIFGALILHELMSAREIAGAAIIFAATIIGQRE